MFLYLKQGSSGTKKFIVEAGELISSESKQFIVEEDELIMYNIQSALQDFGVEAIDTFTDITKLVASFGLGDSVL